MTEDETDKQFREIADAFIDLANSKKEQTHAENIGMAMLYAVSRFNAYVVAMHADNLEKYEADAPQAKAYFLQQYESMLEENIADYKKIYQPPLKYAHLMKEGE
ncbi:MAG TPA: DUF3144 domain-containing protein [Gammaproteobacteria bacterium]|jgi:hypothetical protein